MSKAYKLLAVAAFAALIASTCAQTQTGTFISTEGTGTAAGSAAATSTGAGGFQTSQQQATTQPQPTTTQPQQQPTAAPEEPPTPPAPPVELPSTTLDLEPFNTIALCVPVSLLVLPTTATDAQQPYSLTLEAEDPVQQGLQAQVTPEGILSITSVANFTTNQPIRLTVGLPADQLTAVQHNGPGASIYVAPGFQVPSLNLTTSFGAGQLFVNQASVEQLTVQQSGVGDVVVTGTIASASATLENVSTLRLFGVQQGVELNLSGVSKAEIQQAPESMITGTAGGANAVYFTGGQCEITSSFGSIFGSIFSTCTELPQEELTAPVPQPRWTCGINVEGGFLCQPGNVISSAIGSASTSTTVGGGGASEQTTTTTIGPGAFSSVGGTQAQAGQAAPGAAAGQATARGTGSGAVVSSMTSSSSTSGGGSIVRTETTQGGVTQGFTTTSEGGITMTTGGDGEQQQRQVIGGGVLVFYGPEQYAVATVEECAVSEEEVMIPV